MGLEDKLIWEVTVNGKFSIRSAYYLEVNAKQREENPRFVSLRKGFGGKYGT